MKVQIVIPVVNLWRKYTLPCLESIRTSFEYRVILIDNASGDETNPEARARVGSNFIYHRNGRNLGVSRAWNDGVRDAFENGYELSLILNNDILLHPECIDRLVNRMLTAERDIGLVTAADVREELGTPSNMFRADAAAREGIQESEHPNFSAFLINRMCWEEVGPFDEAFFPAYFEDNDYHFRVRLRQLRAIVHPAAMFYHFGSSTQNESTGKPVVVPRRFEQNRLYYCKKWGGTPGREKFSDPFGAAAQTANEGR